MFPFNFGQGILGRLFSAIIEVLVIILVLVIVAFVLSALGIALPELVGTIVMLLVGLYFIGRVLGLVGPAA